MRVACFGASRMGRKPELSYTVGNCPVCDFLIKVFVTSASSFGSSGEKDVSFLCRSFCADEFLGHFIKSLLRWGWTLVLLEGTEG